MKKAIKALSPLLFIILYVSGPLAAEKMNKPVITTVENSIAIFDFEIITGDKSLSRPLSESVINEFSQSGKYKVIDQSNMDKILKEKKFLMSGCVAEECKVEAGRTLGVGKIVNGSLSLERKTYYLTLKLIDVKTGKAEISAKDECKCELDELLVSTKRLAKKLLIEPKITNSIGMTFIYIKPGIFMMGSPPDEQRRDSDEIQHQVTLTNGFYMQTTEVTQKQWQSIMKKNPSHFKNCGGDCPVEQVSWNDAQEFIKRLNKNEGVNCYRLPTEAEWEYAVRAGTTTPFYTGNCLSTDQANYDGHYPFSGCSKGIHRDTTVKTRSFSPNAWGLYDMHGNVWEWCQDWKEDYPSGSVTDPAGPSSGLNRVNRGGSWFNDARSCVAANRSDTAPDTRSLRIGFRLSRTPLTEKVEQPVTSVTVTETENKLKQP